MKKLLLFPFFLVGGIYIFSQVPDEIANMPLSKVEIIERGRNLLLEALLDDDLTKANRYFNYLENNVSNEHYAAFSPYEKLLLATYLGHYNIALKEIIKTDSIQQIPPFDRKYAIVPNDRQFEQKLGEKFYGYKPLALDEIRNSTLPDEEKSVLIYTIEDVYLYSDARGDDKMFQKLKNELNRKCENFFAKYPNSKYTNYLRTNLYKEEGEYSWGYGIDFLFGYGMVTDDLQNYLSNGAIASMGFSLFYKKALFSFQFESISSQTRQDMVFSDGTVWNAKSKAGLYNSRFNLGYRILDNNRISIAPNAGIGWSSFDPVDKDKKAYPELENVRLSSFAYNVGLLFDFYISPLVTDGVGFPIRFNINYTIPTNFSQDMHGNILTITAGFEMGGRPKTVKNGNVRW